MKSLWSLPVAAVLLIAGCAPFCLGVPCPDCPPPIRVRITNGPIAGLYASIPSSDLTALCTETDCTFLEDTGPGEFEVVVGGAAVASQVVRVTVPEASSLDCCSCGYSTAEVEVTLGAQ